jgi:hypothetical protein
MRPYYRDFDIAKDLKKKPDVQTGMRLILLDMLYDEKITIKEFKAYCVENGVDYNAVEHCCGCVGCYEPEPNSPCPDFESYPPRCQIRDPTYCKICGIYASIGYLDNEDDKNPFWVCDVHDTDEIERDVRKGISFEKIIKKWNK